MAGLRVHVVMPESLVRAVDAALVEGESRGAFVRRAVEQALGDVKADAGRSPSSENAPAPAESPASRAEMFRQATQKR